MTQSSLVITASAYSGMIAHCLQAAPHEACGFLFGMTAPSAITALAFSPVPNVSGQPRDRFEMDPAALISLLYSRSSSNPDLVGIVHSHPREPAVPSMEDLRTGWHAMPSHWIVSLSGSNAPDIRAYRYVRQNDGSLSYAPLSWSLIPDRK